MENESLKKKFKLKENNSYFYINNTPKMIRLSATPVLISNYTKKNYQPINKLNNLENKNVFKKKPYINFNFNVIQNKNMNNKKIRTITPNLRLREIVNRQIRENKNLNFNNIIKCKTELPDIFSINPNHNKSYIHTDSNVRKKETADNMDRQLKLIFVMKNKINELNKVINEKNQEINLLKNGEISYNTIKAVKKGNNNILNDKKTNENHDIKRDAKRVSKERNMNNNNMNLVKSDNKFKKIKNENKNIIKEKEIEKEIDKEKEKDKEKDKEKEKENNKINEITKKYNETISNNSKEIQNLKKKISELENKYQQEINKNKEMNQKYSFIRNCTFGLSGPQLDYEKKIREKEEKIIKLEEKIYEYQKKEEEEKKLLEKERKNKENKENKEKLLLSNEEYFNIQICLNALIKKFNINEENIMKGIDKLSLVNIDKIANNICNLLKISNNQLISNFMNDYIITNSENLNSFAFTELIKYDIFDDNFIHNDLSSFLKERSIIYDYKKKGKIPLEYLRHIYREFCFKNNRRESEKEFFHVVYACKQHNYSSYLFDIFYDNLIIEDEEKNEKAVKMFIDSILNEELKNYT